MRVRAAHEGGLQHSGKMNVIDERPFATQQGRIFYPLEAFTNHPVSPD
jgi:hypothetical protein